MKKPVLFKKIIISQIFFFSVLIWLIWSYIFSANSELTLNEFYYYLILLIIAEGWYVLTTILGYKKKYKEFIKNMVLMGKKEKLINYDIKEIKTNNGNIYYLHGEITIASKKHVIRKTLSSRVGAVLMKTKPGLDLYFDPTNTSRFIYHLAIDNVS